MGNQPGAAMLERFAEIVGKDHFFESPEILEKYSKDHSFVPPRWPLAVIKPKDTDEIQRIIELANSTLMTLIPVSSRPPRFHGDTVPACPGIVVDLSDLEKVIKVDRRNKTVAIEPGVTFGKLKEACEKEEMLPYTPLLPRSTKSVLASALEREPILIPKDHWDFRDPIAGGRVIIGDGHQQGFGDTAGRSKQEVADGKATPVYPVGPANIGWLSLIQGAEGTLGIVPWGVMRCRLIPSIEKPFFIPAQNLRDLLLFLQKVLKPRFVEEIFILNNFSLATILSEKPAEIKNLQTGLPPWILFFNLAGFARYPEEEVAWKEADVIKLASETKVELQESINSIKSIQFLQTLGQTADTDRRLRYKTSCQVLPCETTLDKTPEIVNALFNTAREYEYPEADLGVYIQPIIQGCQCQCEVSIPYDPQNKLENEKVKSFFGSTAYRMHEKGAYYSRPYGALAGITYRDAEIVSVLRKIKGIMDPNNILNSGKLCF